MIDPVAYDGKDLVKWKNKDSFQPLEKFALKNIGNKKIYKLRELLYNFEPVHLTMYMLGVCGRKILVEIDTYDFPDGERRVGIEFVEIMKMNEW